MNSRERLLSVLEGKIPDRVPVSLFLQEDFLSVFCKKTNPDRLLDAIKVAEELNFDLITRQNVTALPHFLSVCTDKWHVDIHNEIKLGNYYRTITIKTPERELRQVEAVAYNESTIAGVHFSTQEYLIKDKDDYVVFKKYRPGVSDSVRSQIITAGEAAHHAIGELGVSCPWAVGGVYNQASIYIGIQNMMMDALTNEEYYRDYMDLFTEIVSENYAVFGQSAFDCVGIHGNVANSAIMSAEFFAQYVFPYEKRAVDVLRNAGKYTIYHNCGYAASFYPHYIDLGITVWETVAAPPQGDNNLSEAKAFFQNRLVLSGCFDQVDFLRNASAAAVEDAAAAMMEAGKPGGHYIFAASDYIEADTPIENLKALLRGANSKAGY